MNPCKGFGLSGIKRVDFCVCVGVSIRYLCPSTSNVNRRVSLGTTRISVAFVSWGGIEIEASCAAKLLALRESCEAVGEVLAEFEARSPKLKVLVILLTAPPLLGS